MARIDVPMPQMGESIAEGTVSKWQKQGGQDVARDEPLLEISTDKVDAEIPSPAAGRLAEIAVGEGQTVEVGTVLAFIETDAAVAGSAPAAASPAPATSPSATAAVPAPAQPPSAPGHVAAAAAAGKPAPAAAEQSATAVAQAPAPTAGAVAGPAQPAADGREETADERLRRRSTPVVRRIAEEHGV